MNRDRDQWLLNRRSERGCMFAGVGSVVRVWRVFKSSQRFDGLLEGKGV